MSKLLIVNNSVALLEIMKNILEYSGYTVKTLMNADDVYNTIHVFQPDLLILDTYIAGEEGGEICKELRKRTETNDLCILMFSLSPKYLKDYISYYDDFIEKPFDLKSLMEKIKSLLHLAAIRKNAFQFRPVRKE
jgi:two-component system response regulator VicR